jgi:acetyl-CoA acetyltransferase
MSARPVYVAGTGLHPFGRFDGKSLTAIGMEAVRAALGEAGVARGGFDAGFCGCVYGGVASGHKVLTALGLAGGPIVNVEAGCASGGAALALGAAQIATGRAERVLVLGLEKMPRGMIRSSFFEPWREEAGLAATPGYFALRAQRLMRESDVRLEDLARVSVTNHAHGVHNPNAMYRKPVTVAQVLASPVVCEPLRLLMLCAPNEGAAALILSATPPGDGPAVRIAAAQVRSHLAGNVLGEHTPLSGLVDDGMPTPTEMAARAAYEEAGLGPGDLDVVELQDTDSARQILSAEELGLCARGGGGGWVRDGGGEMTSRLPVNPSGGLLSKGEPLGASALAQAIEIVQQLRGACGARQVAGARVGLAHTVGRGANACVMIFRR